MKRQFSVINPTVVATGSYPGDEDAVRAANRLAHTADAEFIDAICDLHSFLTRIGGQAYIVADRQKFNAQGQRVDPKETGNYSTLGFVIHYEHIARAAGIEGPREPEVPEIGMEGLVGEQPAEEPEAEVEPEPVATG